jgi:23S rRNA (guanosine2251-2'-O)-methyltransferase
MAKKDAGRHTELIFGVHAILELLKAKRRKLEIIYTTKPTPKSWVQIEKLLPKHLQIQYVSRDVLTKMAGTADHQGILAYAQPFIFKKEFFNAKKEPFLIMLDSIQDVRNVGAIIRSAYCTGASGLILISKQGASLTAAALKASAGLAEHLPIFVAPSIGAALTLLSKAGYQLYAALLHGKDATQVTYQQPLCLVIGNEATGVSKEIMNAGTAITLAQKTEDISYNASVAAGILLFLIGMQIKAIGLQK